MSPERGLVVTKRPGRGRGFSLIEMLVAMVVLSLSLGVLYQASSGATRNVRVAANYVKALLIAESLMATHSYIQETKFILTGNIQGMDWSVETSPLGGGNELNSEDQSDFPDLQHLNVKVTWGDRDPKRQVELHTLVTLAESNQ